jgi:hypothetical protein
MRANILLRHRQLRLGHGIGGLDQNNLLGHVMGCFRTRAVVAFQTLWYAHFPPRQ